MPNNIFHKRSLTPGSVPTTSSLNVGEIAINVPDGKIFVEKSGSAGQSVETVLVSNTTTNIGVLTLSGSLILSGSGTGSALDINADTLIFSGSATITGSLRVTGGITGSLNGTASYAIMTLSASYAPSSLPSVQSVTSSATVTPTANNDLVIITAQSASLTIANPTGTWSEGQALMIRIKDNATARAITWDTNYRAIGVTLPTTTTLSKTTYVGLIYNSTDTKWDATGVVTQA
jgi:hypothetical protein